MGASCLGQTGTRLVCTLQRNLSECPLATAGALLSSTLASLLDPTNDILSCASWVADYILLYCSLETACMSQHSACEPLLTGSSGRQKRLCRSQGCNRVYVRPVPQRQKQGYLGRQSVGVVEQTTHLSSLPSPTGGVQRTRKRFCDGAPVLRNAALRGRCS